MAQDTARAYWRFIVIWLIVGCALGTLAALSLLVPESFGLHPLLGYGRLVSAHRATMIHGVLFSAVYATASTLLPRMNRTVPSARPLSVLIAWSGQVIILLGLFGIILGKGSGHEYADFPVTISFIFWLYLVAAALDIGFQVSVSKSLSNHPSYGILLAAAIIPAVVYPFGLPGWLGTGLFAAGRSWVAWRTIFLITFTASAIGLYLWMPGINQEKFAIHRKSFVLGVALLIASAPFTGIIHLLDAPVSAGLKAWSAFAGVITATAIILLVITTWKKSSINPPGILCTAGLAGLVLTCLQGILMVVPPIYTILHYTLSTARHAHLALGSLTFIFISGALILAPRLARQKAVNTSNTMAGAILIVSGLIMIFLSESIAGVTQAAGASGSSVLPSTLQAIRWMQLGTVTGGILSLIGAVFVGSVILRTLNSPVTSIKCNPETIPHGGDL